MKKLLLVIDMQNDFITGSLGSPAAERIVPNVKAKIGRYRQNGDRVVFTRDTHDVNYLSTQEGKLLPVLHCIQDTDGHRITAALCTDGCEIFDKPAFGSLSLAEHIADTVPEPDEIELCGLCTDICVVSNALILKARFPKAQITVDARCCAGVTEESHNAALLTMKMCQVIVTGYR